MFFKKKIKETKKHGLYGNRYNSNTNVSGWSQLSFIEKFCLITLPFYIGFIFYMMFTL